MSDEALSMKAVLLRGLKERCPKCGQGKLFKGYIKQVDACSECGEDLSDIRAEDAPPWLTILVTGHIVVPIMLELIRHDVLPEAMDIVVGVVLTLICALLILPRAKGVFIAALWSKS